MEHASWMFRGDPDAQFSLESANTLAGFAVTCGHSRVIGAARLVTARRTFTRARHGGREKRELGATHLVQDGLGGEMRRRATRARIFANQLTVGITLARHA